MQSGAMSSDAAQGNCLEEEWETVRPVFTSWYVDEGKTLDETKQEMLKRFNFHAT
jgi:hypothetical protein